MPIQTGLLRLDDDALLSIVSFLYGQEALGVALTSKRLHALAISRVAAHAKCLSSSALIRLHDYLRIRGPQPRVQHLEILYIYVGHELDAEQAVDPLRILAELLAAAKNLRLLTVAELPEVLDLHSSIGDALVTLPNLVNLRLCDGVDGRTLELLSLMRGSLKRLLLSYEWKAQSATTDAALFNVLVKHTRLQRLCLYNFLPSGPLNHASIFSNARFSSLRRLYMVAVNVEALDLVCFCPYLTHLVLVLGLAEEEYAPRTAFEPDDSRRWPSLQELYLQVVTIGVTSCIQRRISQVDKIRIPSRLAPCHSDELRGPLPAVLRTASPVQLSLTVVAETETINALAPTLAALPRLRALELRVMLSRWHIEDDAEAWLVSADALAGRARVLTGGATGRHPRPAERPAADEPVHCHPRGQSAVRRPGLATHAV